MTNQGLIRDGREFPLIIELNFTKLIESGLERAKNDDPLARLLQNFLTNPRLEKLKSGLRTEEEIAEYKDEITFLMDTVFPHPLRNNEIKAASVPFVDLVFHKSSRFQKLLDEAGPDFKLTTRNMDDNNAYIFG